MIEKSKVVVGIIVGVLIVGIVILISSITTVPTGYVGIKTRFGQVQEDMIQEGFNFKAPFIESIVKIDCRTQKYEVTTEASSKDLQKVNNIKDITVIQGENTIDATTTVSNQVDKLPNAGMKKSIIIAICVLVILVIIFKIKSRKIKY